MNDPPERWRPSTGDGADDHPLRDEYPVADLSLDTVFDILSVRRRRYALYVLAAADGGVADLTSVADRIADREADGDATDGIRERVADSLHHHHLPRLDDAGVVDYDEHTGDIRYWGHPVVEEYLLHVAPVEWD